ncbi:hypothetical protein RB3436 [Rhodopirellula baltica SH 1]|uniref:Uncharacterized protein n=1 Tax=Rhodopirellula baltica (strain DSM 10527 / NCIMB 13988 / SH1) TaxID=243090 RepID=Q7UU88_RHOBA|nr:hypothetical protein RB3436 [Rhodopirellula baltica SH 1]
MVVDEATSLVLKDSLPHPRRILVRNESWPRPLQPFGFIRWLRSGDVVEYEVDRVLGD